MQFNLAESTLVEMASRVELLLLDVDGVLTDGRLYFTNSGDEIKSFSTLDGHGIKMLRQGGVETGIITGRTSTLLERRARDLGIELLYQGREDKLAVLDEILAGRAIDRTRVAYAGDDFPDLPVLRAVGLSFSVPAGHPDVRARVHAVTGFAGGAGAVREICDFILKARGDYAQYFSS